MMHLVLALVLLYLLGSVFDPYRHIYSKVGLTS